MCLSCFLGWAEKHGASIVCGPDTLFRLPKFRLPNTDFRGPDAAWIRKERLEAFTDEELDVAEIW